MFCILYVIISCAHCIASHASTQVLSAVVTIGTQRLNRARASNQVVEYPTQQRLNRARASNHRALTRADMKLLRCEYSAEVFDLMKERQYQRIDSKAWQSKAIPPTDSPQYIVISTPGSYENHLFQPISYQYHWSAENDPPASGEGSRGQIKFHNAYVPR